MGLPLSLVGNEYVGDLRGFREAALRKSYLYGSRKQIGKLCFGSVKASWRMAQRGDATLIETGTYYDGSRLFNDRPTTLRLMTPYNVSKNVFSGFVETTFKMDLDNSGKIEIYRNIIESGTFRELARIALSREGDQSHGLNIPSDEDRELLYLEMERGASGEFKLPDSLFIDGKEDI